MKEMTANFSVLMIVVALSGIFLSLGLSGRVSSEILKDFEGNQYKAVVIGEQTWMAENLRSTKTQDGTPVLSFFPNDDSNAVAQYGRLYTWETALTIAPKGWHLPTDAEWYALEKHLGKNTGAKLKDTVLWRSTNTGATNPAGFSARPAGYWNDSGFENNFGSRAVFWSSTKQDSHFVWSRTLSHDHDSLRRAPQHPQYGFSVRCIKDVP